MPARMADLRVAAPIRVFCGSNPRPIAANDSLEMGGQIETVTALFAAERLQAPQAHKDVLRIPTARVVQLVRVAAWAHDGALRLYTRAFSMSRELTGWSCTGRVALHLLIRVTVAIIGCLLRDTRRVIGSLPSVFAP